MNLIGCDTMKIITSTEARNILNKLGIRGVWDANDLDFYINNNKNVEYLCESDVLVRIYHDNNSDYISVIPLSDCFSSDLLIETIKQGSKNLSVFIDTNTLHCEFAEQLEVDLSPYVQYRKSRIDLAFSGKAEAVNFENIRLLNVSDKDNFEAMPYEKPEYRPPLSVLFDHFVTNDRGYVLGAFDGKDIVGFLSFDKIGDKTFDVDYVYTAPEKRNRGFGRKLALTHRSFAVQKGYSAYWSYARNEASENTAKSCGFSLVRNVRIYTR